MHRRRLRAHFPRGSAEGKAVRRRAGAGHLAPRAESCVLLAPYYRRFELPWEGDSEASERFRRILQIVLAVFVLLGVLFPLLPAPPRMTAEEAVPQRLARVMIEQVKPPPPPPPPPVVQEPPK